MNQNTPLETITKREADVLVNSRIFGDKTMSVVGPIAASSSAGIASIWYWATNDLGQKILDYKLMIPSLPDWNYDNIFTGIMAFSAVFLAGLTASAIKDWSQVPGRYAANPAEFMRTEYNKKLI